MLMAKGGIICEVIDGPRKGQRASVANDQQPAFLKAKKVHAFFFNSDESPILQDGKHVNGLISLEKLKQIGFYD